jgi:arsenate reductase
MPQRRVLFLCTGNSCRSQMAEAMTNQALAGSWQAFSAGSMPAGYVHPLALRALEEIGIHHQGRSKSVEEFHGQPFDLVITVCAAAAQNCPVWLGAGRKVHIGFPDPAAQEGSEAERLAAFRALRADIQEKIIPFLRELAQEKDSTYLSRSFTD